MKTMNWVDSLWDLGDCAAAERLTVTPGVQYGWRASASRKRGRSFYSSAERVSVYDINVAPAMSHEMHDGVLKGKSSTETAERVDCTSETFASRDRWHEAAQAPIDTGFTHALVQRQH